MSLITTTNPLDESQGSPIFRRQFSDIDQLTQQVQTLSKVEMTQLSCDRLNFDLVLASFPEIQFCFATSSCPTRTIGEKLKNFVTFGCILETQDGYLISHNHRVSPDTFFGMDSNLEAHVVLPAHQKYAWVQIRQDVLQEYLKVMGRVDLDDRFWANNFVRAPATMPIVKAYLSQLLIMISQDSIFLKQPHLKTLLLEDFVPFLINAIPFQTEDLLSSPPALKRTKLVKQAEDYMLAHLDQPITLKDLCQALHVSSRPVFYSFQEIFGVSPMEYLKVQRLQRVRRALQIADPESNSVMAIAERYGFWSGGHFARDYKTMFGELPSDTLKRVSK